MFSDAISFLKAQNPFLGENASFSKGTRQSSFCHNFIIWTQIGVPFPPLESG